MKARDFDLANGLTSRRFYLNGRYKLTVKEGLRQEIYSARRQKRSRQGFYNTQISHVLSSALDGLIDSKNDTILSNIQGTAKLD
jgi:hypothetical protein